MDGPTWATQIRLDTSVLFLKATQSWRDTEVKMGQERYRGRVEVNMVKMDYMKFSKNKNTFKKE